MSEQALQEWFPIIVGALLIGSAWIFQWWRKRPVKDAPEGTPYSIYTTEFDQVVMAGGLSERLPACSPDHAKGFLEANHRKWEKAVADSEKIFCDLKEPEPSHSPLPKMSANTAVTLLIDQSGSMKGEPMAYTAAAVRKLTEIFDAMGVKTEVIGFTTAGWHGGFARRQWIANGRPPRPGRLCSLLHIIYKSFDEAAFTDAAWREMLNPDLLRENIDGEAIEFAEQRLLQQPTSQHILIVISDGAPVDDSSLIYNGPSFLYRHIIEVISRIQAGRKIDLRAIGIHHRVSEYYEISRRAHDGDSLVAAALELIGSQ